MLSLDSKVSEINKIGKALATRLKYLEIETVRDLIFYYPFRYNDYSIITPINKLQIGATTTVIGKIELIDSRRTPRKRKLLTEALVADSTGSVKVIWFNQPWIAKNLKPGDSVSLSGKVSGNLLDVYLNSPEYEKVNFKNGLHTARIVPIYSLTEGISQKQLRFLINEVIDLADSVDDYLPDFILKKLSFNPLSKAIRNIHFPKNKEAIEQAKNGDTEARRWLTDRAWGKAKESMDLNVQPVFSLRALAKETDRLEREGLLPPPTPLEEHFN